MNPKDVATTWNRTHILASAGIQVFGEAPRDPAGSDPSATPAGREMCTVQVHPALENRTFTHVKAVFPLDPRTYLRDLALSAL